MEPELPEGQAERLFKVLDVHGDGLLRREDLGFALQALNPTLFAAASLEKTLDAIDTNGDGQIPLRDFLCWLFDKSHERAVLRQGAVQLLGRGTDHAGHPSQEVNPLFCFGGVSQRGAAVDGHMSWKLHDTGEVFNPKTGEWAQVSWPATVHTGGCLAFAGDRLFAVGGAGEAAGDTDNTWLSDEDCGVTAALDAFDPVEGVWESLPPMQQARRRCAVAVVNDSLLYVFGGCSETGETLASVEVFDTKSQAWAELPPMLEARHNCSTLVSGRQIYVFGGGSDCRRPAAKLKSVEVFDIDRNSWRSVSPMCEGRVNCFVFESRGRLLALGDHADWEPACSSEIYDPHTEAWSLLPAMQHPRSCFTALGTGGKFYAFGGLSLSKLESVPLVEVLEVEEEEEPDKENGSLTVGGATSSSFSSSVSSSLGRWSWRELPQMAHARIECGCVVSGGKIVVLGGLDPKDEATDCTVEAFDCETQNWTPLPPMFCRRQFPSQLRGRCGGAFSACCGLGEWFLEAARKSSDMASEASRKLMRPSHS